jgi:predicted small metal-binding protein
MPRSNQRIPKGSGLARVIRCECGYVVRGENDDELVADAERHIQSDHPDLVGEISREDLLAMKEEE